MGKKILVREGGAVKGRKNGVKVTDLKNNAYLVKLKGNSSHMIEKKITICYEEFASVEEMSLQDQKLVAAALEAQKGSYSPYSRFQVGAAAL